jgi:predicted RNA binding protein YcfA (HicA-like mRNA interferase family)
MPWVKRAMTRKLPSVKPKLVIRARMRNGFVIHHITGSHYFLKKDKRRVSVPYHNKDLKPGTLASVVKQAGLTVEEFVGLL